jgi:N-acetylmuramoyl-L-alanine amidase
MLVRKNILSLTVFCLALCFAGLSCVTAQGLHTVVIDAGHGSTRFPGARYGNVCEKDINLKVALRLGALIENNMPSVKVIYTRKVDKNFSSDLRTDLQARADIANRASGDLFISIHSNASRNTAVRGVETLIMGESSLETRVNEETLFAYNKDEVMDMSDEKTAALVRAYIQNLQFTYGEYSEAMARFIQKQYVKLGRHNRGVRKQPLRVLYATDMPSVLTEIGFMSNPTELKYITSEKGQSEIANAIYAAVKEYDALLRRTSLADTTPQSQEPVTQPSANVAKPSVAKPSVAKPSEAKPASVKYAVQILASDRKLDTSSSRFKSYRGKVAVVRGQGALPYKYCVGSHSDRKSAQASVATIAKSFPGAFVVAVSDGKIVK